MKANEFLAEVLQSSTCPTNFEEDYHYLQQYQSILQETLKEFHRVCEKNGINYHVTFGSLLGIIRDGGFIPWDSDIDTFVPISQREELVRALKQDLSDDYYAMCQETTEGWRSYIMRICPKRYNSAAVHLDVFYYCGAPNDEKERKTFCKKLIRCARIRFTKKVKIKEESCGKWKRALKLAAAKAIFGLYSGKKTDMVFERLIHKYPLEKSRYVVPTGFFADEYLIPIEMATGTMLLTGSDPNAPTRS